VSWVSEKIDDRIKRGVACSCHTCRSGLLRFAREIIEEAARRSQALCIAKHYRSGAGAAADEVLAMLEDEE